MTVRFEGWVRGGRFKKVVVAALGLCRASVIMGWALVERDGARPLVEVEVRAKARRRGRCGRAAVLLPKVSALAHRVERLHLEQAIRLLALRNATRESGDAQ